MKIFILLFFLLSTISSFSQKLHYSISAGTNYSFFTHNSSEPQVNYPLSATSGFSFTSNRLEPEFKSKGKVGFYLNANLSIPIREKFWIVSGFGFSLMKDEYEVIYPDFNNSILLDYIIENDAFAEQIELDKKYINKIYVFNIPLLLQVDLLKQRLNIIAGVEMNMLIQAKERNKTRSKGDNENVNDSFDSRFLSMKFGLKYRLIESVFLEAGFTRSFESITKKSNNYPTYKGSILSDVNTNINSFSLGLSFQL